MSAQKFTAHSRQINSNCKLFLAISGLYFRQFSCTIYFQSPNWEEISLFCGYISFPFNHLMRGLLRLGRKFFTWGTVALNTICKFSWRTRLLYCASLCDKVIWWAALHGWNDNCRSQIYIYILMHFLLKALIYSLWFNSENH